MNSIIAVDIETTGLDPHKDSIIEIGIVRFNLKRIETQWSSLINPGRKIPPFITQLTGIDDHMVLNKPSIKEVVPVIRDLIGGTDIILGHNISFDLSFLQKHGLTRSNDTMDTYEIASVLLPTAGRYNLEALRQKLNIPHQANHRALDDALWNYLSNSWQKLYVLVRELIGQVIPHFMTCYYLDPGKPSRRAR
jgi:ATP-dependent DNA helicase DinG